MEVQSILAAKGTGVMTTRPGARIGTVVRKMRLEKVGALVVSDDGERVQGLITERDVVHGLAEHGVELLGLKVAEPMARGGPTCTRRDNIRKVMAVMTQRRVRHLPVVEGGRLGGIISSGDVVKNRLEEVELESNVLRDLDLATRWPRRRRGGAKPRPGPGASPGGPADEGRRRS